MYPRVKEISGRKYVYLVAGARIRDKVTQRTLAYLGPLSVLAFGIPESTKRKTERKVRELIDWKNLGKRIKRFPVEFNDFDGSRRPSLRARAVFRQRLPRRINAVTRDPSRLLAQRTPGELEALTRIADRNFKSTFRKIGPYTYELRSSKV